MPGGSKNRKKVTTLSIGLLITVLTVGLVFLGGSGREGSDFRREYPPELLLAINSNNSISNENPADVDNLLKSSIRILCLCVTTAKHHATRAIFVKATWAKRCTQTIFVSDETDERIGAIGFTRRHRRSDLWAKTRISFQWAHDNHINNFDWFLKADDDTFIIVENLRSFLVNYDPSKPHYFGRHFIDGHDPLSLAKAPEVSVHYASGGAGYVLSWNALAKLVGEAFQLPLYCPQPSEVTRRTLDEDVEMGRCLASVGIHVGDTRDEQGKQRFFPFQPAMHLDPAGVQDDDWIRVCFN